MRPSAAKLILVLLLLLMWGGCSSSGVRSNSAKSERKVDPCEALRQRDPHCGWKPHWYDYGVSTDAVDGTKTQFLMLESSDPDGVDYGDLHYAKLTICFKNGKLCGGRNVGVGVTVHGIVSSLSHDRNYGTRVRLKFDDERPVLERWAITANRVTLFPNGSEKQFLSQLLHHQKFILELSYYKEASRTITFELAALADRMQAAGLQDPTPEPDGAGERKSVIPVLQREPIP